MTSKPAALHIVAGLDPRYGGPSYCVPRLCRALEAGQAEARILTVRGADTPSAPHLTAFPQDFASAPGLGRLRLSAALARAARQGATTATVVHVHGVWLMPNIYAGRAAAGAGKPLVVSPRGMLSPAALAYSRRRKALFWRLLQGPAYAGAACWHATSEQEAEELRAFGIRAPIAIIPNGVDLPPLRPRGRGPGTVRTILFLGRIHPKKGLDLLLDAWSAVAAERPGWRLRIVGPDEAGHRAELEARLARLRAPRVGFDGPLYDGARDAAFSEADLFVLPTRSENFGLTVAEALGAGTPAIVSRGAPWPGLETERCGWWIEQGAGPLTDALLGATSLPESERNAMGARGRAWIERDFGWEPVAAKMTQLYGWVSGKGLRPEFITLC